MPYESKPGQFALFRNNKDGVETRPDYTGDGLALDGTPIRISAWIKEGKSGKFMSCNMQVKERVSAAKPQAKGDTGFNEMDDDIPF